MAHWSFTIKIGDMLRERWKSDIIEFEWLDSHLIDKKTKDWISWTIKVESLNEYTIMVTVQDLQIQIHETCDYSLTEFIRKIHSKWEQALYILPEYQDEFVDKDDIVYDIDAKDESINIEKQLTDIIWLETPTVIVNPKYQKEYEENCVDEDTDWLDYMESKINFQ